MQDEVDRLLCTATLCELDTMIKANELLVKCSAGLDIQHYYEEYGHALRHARDVKEYIYINGLPQMWWEPDTAGQILYLQKRLNDLSPKSRQRQGVTSINNMPDISV